MQNYKKVIIRWEVKVIVIIRKEVIILKIKMMKK